MKFVDLPQEPNRTIAAMIQIMNLRIAFLESVLTGIR